MFFLFVTFIIVSRQDQLIEYERVVVYRTGRIEKKLKQILEHKKDNKFIFKEEEEPFKEFDIKNLKLEDLTDMTLTTGTTMPASKRNNNAKLYLQK